MLEILDFIAERGGDPDRIRESQRRRFASVDIVDEIITLYQENRQAQYDATVAKAEANATQRELRLKTKAPLNSSEHLAHQKQCLEEQIHELTSKANDKEVALRAKLSVIGNIIDDSVPVHDDEAFNPVVRQWGVTEVQVMRAVERLPHHKVLGRLDGYDPERGVKLVGHRGYFLKNWGVFLNQALINYGLEFLSERDYTILQTPQFMLKGYMARTAQLDEFDEQLYKVTDGAGQNDKYLIATSEQPISAFHADEWLQAKDLPLKYAGFSSCYRREAGAHGRDAWGIFRVHQFEKVEQFVLAEPEKSGEAFERMLALSEAFYQSLGIPYRVVSIVSGALNNASAKKQDLEAWFPFQKEYKELVSCSNCTDYQSRALNIRLGLANKQETRKKYPHALNCTLCATERTLCCLLENFQTEDGFRVPIPLRKYLPGCPDFIPYAK